MSKVRTLCSSLCWSFVAVVTSTGQLDQRTGLVFFGEQGKTRFGIQKREARNTDAVERKGKCQNNFFPLFSLLISIINKCTTST